MIPFRHRANALLVVVFAFMFLLNISFVSAQDNWFIDDYKWADDSIGIYSTWNPKVACVPDTSECVALIYDSVSTDVIVYHSTNYFQNYIGVPFCLWGVICEHIPTARSTGYCSASFNDFNYTEYGEDKFSLPMDVMYRQSDGKFWIAVWDSIYTFSITDSPKLTFKWDMNDVYPAENKEKFNIMKFVDEESYYVLWWQVGDGSSPNVQERILWLTNNSIREPYMSMVATVPEGCYPESVNCQNELLLMRGYVPRDYDLASGGQYGTYKKYAFRGTGIRWRNDVNCTKRQWTNSTALGSFPTDYTGIWFWLNNYLYYHRNASGNISAGVWKVLSTDLTTYSTEELVYIQNSTVNETIWFADGRRTNNYNIFQTDKENNRTSPYSLLSGVYAYREQLNDVRVSSFATDPITEESTDVTSTGVLRCLGTNYTYTDTDESYSLYTICDEDVQVQLYVSGYKPVYYSTTFDFDSGLCPTFFIDAHYFQSYRAYIKVIDIVTGDPVSGATVELDSEINTTNSNGWTSFLISPVDVTNFTETYAEGSCLIDLRPTGIVKPYYVRITADGFTTYLDTGVYFATATTVGNQTFFEYDDVKTFQLDRGAIYRIKVRTDAGIEVFGSGVIVTTSGANQTFLEIDGSLLPTNQATSFPAVFRLIDDRSSYTVYFNLTQGNFTDSHTDTIINTTSHYLYTFYIPDQQCQTVADCVESYCIGKNFYEITSCTGGECIYDIESCFLFCDNEVGCHEGETTEQCYFDTDCTDECIDAGNLRVSSCGVNNKCVEHSIECPYGCIDVTDGEDYCESAPLVVECDQTTTIGMLNCLHSGVLGFIAGSYDPMVYIMFIIFVMVLLVTLISLAFKGTQNVIR